MKKLMFAAGAVLCATVGSAIESDVVGYSANNVTAGDRAMRAASTFLAIGNDPTALKITDVTQTAGDPGDLTLCTYDDNVTRQAQYWFFSTEATSGELPEGWYALDANGEPDFEGGVQEVTFAAGDGFVVVSANSSATLTFPKAL